MAVNYRRKMYSVLRGAFSDGGIIEYIRDTAGGRGRISQLRKDTLTSIVPVEAWNGKDGEVR